MDFKNSASSLISRYAYDDASWVLTLVFKGKDDELRHYAGFPPDLFEEFDGAESQGKFFNANIAKKYTVQVEPAPTKDVYVPKQEPKGEFADEMQADIESLQAQWEHDLSAKSQTRQPDGLEIASLFGDEPAKVEESPAVNGFDSPSRYEQAFDEFAQTGDLKSMGDPIEPEQPEIMTTDQAIAVISPKNPKADALTAKAHEMAAVVIPVIDDASYKKLTEHLGKLTTVRKALFEIVDPYREISYRAYEQIAALNKAKLGPPDVALKAGKQALLTWETAQTEKKREAQRIADELAAKAAEIERLKRQEELTLAEVSDALASGEMERADYFMANPIEVAPLPVFAPRVTVYTPPAPTGQSTRKNWKGECLDLEKLILDVAAGIEHFKKHGHLGGHAASNVLTANESSLSQLAKSQEDKFNVPGCRAWNAAVKSIKGS